jgi:hypothetical protein
MTGFDLLTELHVVICIRAQCINVGGGQGLIAGPASRLT